MNPPHHQVDELVVAMVMRFHLPPVVAAIKGLVLVLPQPDGGPQGPKGENTREEEPKQ